MFNKKNCKKCNEKLSNKYKFCPNCGIRLNEKDWGMLGKTDAINMNQQNSFAGGGMLNKMLGNAMKMLEREMGKQENSPKTNFKLMINGKEVKFNNQIQKQPVKIEKIPIMEFTQEQLNDFLEFPRKEPKTNLKRFGEKITYEIEMPEVKSFKDILINRLESSIEIKAIGKKKSYSKIIPVNMPIVSQNLTKGKLILELKENLNS